MALAQKSVGLLLSCLAQSLKFRAANLLSVYGSRRRVERARRLTYFLAKILRLLSLDSPPNSRRMTEDGGLKGAQVSSEVWVPHSRHRFYEQNLDEFQLKNTQISYLIFIVFDC